MFLLKLSSRFYSIVYNSKNIWHDLSNHSSLGEVNFHRRGEPARLEIICRTNDRISAIVGLQNAVKLRPLDNPSVTGGEY